jgi:nucleotide-binding universal stress UspA family protein
MFEKIIVGVDGSESSIYALEYAAQIADEDKAELKIISAAEPPPPFTIEATGITPVYKTQYREEIVKTLEETQKTQKNRLSKKYPDLQFYSEVREGRPSQIIREASKDSDLIVIGHRGQGGIISWLLGTVAKQILESCTIPVLVVKNPDYCPIQ